MEDARKRIDESLDRLATALENGQSETLKKYLAVMGRFHRYSLGNQLLIAMQRPDATQVAGFHAWKRLGRWVKAGEHGIAIVAPMVRKVRPVHEPDEKALSAAREHIVCFKGCRVFDIAQTDGKALAEFAAVRGDPAEHLPKLKGFVKSCGIDLEYADDLRGALGLSAGGRIMLRRGLSASEEFSTLSHELAHELLHREKEVKVARNIRELEAEAVAFVVCQAIGLDTNTAACDYIQLYQADRKLLMASLGRIRETAAVIIGGLKLDERYDADALNVNEVPAVATEVEIAARPVTTLAA